MVRAFLLFSLETAYDCIIMTFHSSSGPSCAGKMACSSRNQWGNSIWLQASPSFRSADAMFSHTMRQSSTLCLPHNVSTLSCREGWVMTARGKLDTATPNRTLTLVPISYHRFGTLNFISTVANCWQRFKEEWSNRFTLTGRQHGTWLFVWKAILSYTWQSKQLQMEWGKVIIRPHL